jgi:hypothetical protein
MMTRLAESHSAHSRERIIFNIPEPRLLPAASMPQDDVLVTAARRRTKARHAPDHGPWALRNHKAGGEASKNGRPYGGRPSQDWK